MPVPSVRVLQWDTVMCLGTLTLNHEISELAQLQTDSYQRFLQLGVPHRERKLIGLEAILREIFPINSFDGQIELNYVRYELGRPRYSSIECKQLRLTHGMPLRVTFSMRKEELIEEEVYLGDVPVMLGGGEFIINGAERVVVSQLHRSPGVDFVVASEAGEKRSYSCRIIPERGSWIELNITKKEGLSVRIDQSGKFAATTLIRAMDAKYSTNAELVKFFYDVVSTPVAEAIGLIAVEDVIAPSGSTRVGEIIADFGVLIQESMMAGINESGIELISTVSAKADPLLLNTLRDDVSASHEDALLRIYQRLRPGNPPALDKAIDLFHERFFDVNRYRLGIVGRFRINRKFQQKIDDAEMTLNPTDYLNSIRYLIRLRASDTNCYVDDIDNLGNRRLRTIDELATEEIRKGFLKLRRTAQERMAIKDIHDMSPRSLINPKSVSAAIDFFFGRSELSQVVDQTNPLSMLTHERRLSALGPGGLNRKRAGFEVRDVHISHYGRVCPIETPEGTNIGLISSLGIFARVDEYGFLTTPYRVVEDCVVTKSIDQLRADEESDVFVVPADTELDQGRIVGPRVLARHRNDVEFVDVGRVTHIDMAPSQMVGVSASLIPFLEHDDANRALMGSNMQRQAVPLLIPECPIVGTGMEKIVAQSSGMVVRSKRAGVVSYVDAVRIEISGDNYQLRKFTGLNERTCLNQRPIVAIGEQIQAGQVIADGAATSNGELALGRNVLVAFMSWDGYNFEDAIILSERLVRDDVYSSIHIDEFDIEVRETKLGREEFTRDIPNVSEKSLRHLDDGGVVLVGTHVVTGDILVGKVSPKAKTELTPEEKLLHAIFGRAGEEVKNESLEVPSGVDGIVLHTERFCRKMSLSDQDRKLVETRGIELETSACLGVSKAFKIFLPHFEEAFGESVRFEDGSAVIKSRDEAAVSAFAERFSCWFDALDLRSPAKGALCRSVLNERWGLVEVAIEGGRNMRNESRRGDELQNGVMQLVKVYVACKRQISVGDKMAGRHGNKGVISKVLPVEDMPYLDDGTAVDIILNPLGVPSRMNVGQILETHLGWAASKLGIRMLCPVFDGPSENVIRGMLSRAGLPEDGKAHLNDGRSGERHEQKTTVGYIYMLKLHHLVDDKIHARATGPYSLITQQPLGGKARFGGQRFGEMEVWALEAYGAAYILQELLTVKSDDVEGRTKIYESMVKGENTLEAGTPASFDVLTNEIRGLALNLRLVKI